MEESTTTKLDHGVQKYANIQSIEKDLVEKKKGPIFSVLASSLIS